MSTVTITSPSPPHNYYCYHSPRIREKHPLPVLHAPSSEPYYTVPSPSTNRRTGKREKLGKPRKKRKPLAVRTLIVRSRLTRSPATRLVDPRPTSLHSRRRRNLHSATHKCRQVIELEELSLKGTAKFNGRHINFGSCMSSNRRAGDGRGVGRV